MKNKAPRSFYANSYKKGERKHYTALLFSNKLPDEMAAVIDEIPAWRDNSSPEDIQIASGQGHSLCDIAEIAGGIAGRPLEIRLDPEGEPGSDFITDIIHDITKSQTRLNFISQRCMADAMRSLHKSLAR